MLAALRSIDSNIRALAGDVAQQRRAEVAVQFLGTVQDLDQAIGAVPVALQHRLQFGVRLRHRGRWPGAVNVGSSAGLGSFSPAAGRPERTPGW